MVAVDPAFCPLTDDIGFVTRSILALEEDGVLLGPGHAAHDSIAMTGQGQYSHWRHTLYFSTSDNTDPNTNGRHYTIRPSEEVYFTERACYALNTVEFYSNHLSGGLDSFKDILALEIGPGPDMGTVLAIACLGARVCAVERYLADWRTDWHDKFVVALEVEMQRRNWPFDPMPLQRSLKAQAFDPERVQLLRSSIEDLADNLDNNVDFSASHAAFEHLYAINDAFDAVYRVMKPGTRGVHRVDFRDHRNFAAPLDFLLLSNSTYDELSGDRKYEHGNRVRPSAMHKILRSAGFAEVVFTACETADPHYIEEFLPRLRLSTDSPFRETPHEELITLGGFFTLIR